MLEFFRQARHDLARLKFIETRSGQEAALVFAAQAAKQYNGAACNGHPAAQFTTAYAVSALVHKMYLEHKSQKP